MTDPAPGGVPACGILLAAGAGRRMGRPKASVRLGGDGGQTLLERGVRMLHDGGCDPLVVVLGAGQHESGELPVTLVENPDWESGMASSLRAGLAAAQGPAAVVALVDQPGITAAAVRRLRAAHRPGYATCATFDGALRTPVLFDAALWLDVSSAVSGDAGARYWLRRHPALVIPVACDDVADPTDLDVPEDLTRWEGPGA
jgi:CTP:molybdopterin cytidylyltransferase MocA